MSKGILKGGFASDNRLAEINKAMHNSTLPDLGKVVYSSFRRKLNDDINFIDEFF